ncbi:hypothetical protein Btru_044282 [Bulinus truncatus]|nr:hypothetical protein Btru_044282 [Bulinus truncatus]
MAWCSHSLSARSMSVIVLCLIFLCITLGLWLQYRISRPTYRGVEDIDPQLWNLLGPQDVLTQKPFTKRTPQIHIKNFPLVKMQDFWTVKEVEEQFYRQV